MYQQHDRGKSLTAPCPRPSRFTYVRIIVASPRIIPFYKDRSDRLDETFRFYSNRRVDIISLVIFDNAYVFVVESQHLSAILSAENASTERFTEMRAFERFERIIARFPSDSTKSPGRCLQSFLSFILRGKGSQNVNGPSNSRSR